MSNPIRDGNAAAAVSAAVLLTAAAIASAYPEGAPWGAANPEAEESCGDCHYDFEPVLDSEALVLEGLPDFVDTGDRYDFVLRFTDTDAKISGFQIAASSDAGDAGRFSSADAAIETAANAIRSTETRPVDNEVRWNLSWQAPVSVDGGRDKIVFYIAASAANDDQSPFGDVIHYRRFETAVDNQENE